jgi:hypothetical protein
MKKRVWGWSLVLGLWAGYALSGAGCSQQGPYDGAAGAPGTGSAGSAPSGAAGSASPGAGGSELTGAAGSPSTGAGGSEITGAAGTQSIGAGGSELTGAAGADSTGAAGSEITGTAGSSSSGTAGADSTGAAGSDSTGAAGTTGAAGSGSPGPATFAYTFDTSLQGWELNAYADTNRKNLAAPASGSTPTPTLAWDGSTGDPTAGSLKATATFTDWKQFVDAMINVSPAKSIPGRVLRVRVKLVSGKFTGGAQIHANTGSSYRYAAGTWTTIASGQWVELTLDLDAAHAADSAFDPTMVVQVGVKFDTGGDGGSSAFGSAVAAVFQIDTFSDGD